MKARCALVFAVALCFPSEGYAQVPSWMKHVGFSSILTVAAHVVLKDPWIGGSFAAGLSIGHEIGQARVRRRWTDDNTRDLVGGTAGAVFTALFLDRFATPPAELHMLGLKPLTPTAELRSWYEGLAQCLNVPAHFDRVRWIAAHSGSLAPGHVIVLPADPIGSAAAVNRPLHTHFRQFTDRDLKGTWAGCSLVVH